MRPRCRIDRESAWNLSVTWSNPLTTQVLFQSAILHLLLSPQLAFSVGHHSSFDLLTGAAAASPAIPAFHVPQGPGTTGFPVEGPPTPAGIAFPGRGCTITNTLQSQNHAKSHDSFTTNPTLIVL